MSTGDPITFGVDVSGNQPALDWAAIRNGGIRFGFAKATEGTGYVDPMYANHIRGIRANLDVAGAYHFLRTGSAAAQCANFVRTIGDPTGLLCAVDVEVPSILSNGVWIPSPNPADWPTIDDARQFVATWRQAHPSHPLFVYSGFWYWAGAKYPIKNADGSKLGPLWDSRYVAGVDIAGALYPTVPSTWWSGAYGGWAQATVLQFSCHGRVPGYSDDMDLDAFRGSIDELRALAAPAAPVPVEVPMLEFTLTPGRSGTGTIGTATNIRGLRLADGSYVALPLGKPLRMTEGLQIAAHFSHVAAPGYFAGLVGDPIAIYADNVSAFVPDAASDIVHPLRVVDDATGVTVASFKV